MRCHSLRVQINAPPVPIRTGETDDAPDILTCIIGQKAKFPNLNITLKDRSVVRITV